MLSLSVEDMDRRPIVVKVPTYLLPILLYGTYVYYVFGVSSYVHAIPTYVHRHSTVQSVSNQYHSYLFTVRTYLTNYVLLRK